MGDARHLVDFELRFGQIASALPEQPARNTQTIVRVM